MGVNIQNKRHVLYVVIGLMLTCNTPLMSSLSVSFVVMPTLAMVAAILLALISMHNFTLTFCSLSVLGKWLMIITPVYLLLTTGVGAIHYNVPIQYPLWTLSIFFLWIFILPWFFLEKNKVIVHSLSLGVLLGAIINSFAVILDVWGMSPVLSVMKLFDIDLGLSSIGPWGYLSEAGFFKSSGGVGLFSFSRTATGFFLAISTAIVLVLDIKNICKISIQVILFVGILYTGSRLGFISWIFIMVAGYRTAGWRKQLSLIMGYLGLCIIGLQLGFFNERLQGRLLGNNESYVEALTIRSHYQTQFSGVGNDQIGLFYELRSVGHYLFGAGAGNTGYSLALNKSGYNLYSAHGFIFQYIADIGVVGAIVFLFILINGIRAHWKNKDLWGLYASFLLCAIVADFFFPKPQSLYMPILFTIIFITLKNNSKYVSLK